jgi:hypothetical protein
MVITEQLRACIGLFRNHGPKSSSANKRQTVTEDGGWSELCVPLLVCSIMLWSIYSEHRLLCVLGPYVNTLALSGDIEVNPGPTMEEQFQSLLATINKNCADMNANIDKRLLADTQRPGS